MRQKVGAPRRCKTDVCCYNSNCRTRRKDIFFPNLIAMRVVPTKSSVTRGCVARDSVTVREERDLSRFGDICFSCRRKGGGEFY